MLKVSPDPGVLDSRAHALSCSDFLPLTSFPGNWKNNSEMAGLGTHDPFFLLSAQTGGIKWASVLLITILPP